MKYSEIVRNQPTTQLVINNHPVALNFPWWFIDNEANMLYTTDAAEMVEIGYMYDCVTGERCFGNCLELLDSES